MNLRETDLLIVGGESDPNTQRIVDQAHLRGKDYFFWDTDQPQAQQIAWDFESPRLDLGSERVQPRSIYLRYNVFGSDAARSNAAFEVVESFAFAWQSIQMLNRKTAGDANNKSRNLVRARRCGFEIPETIVLGDLSPLATLPSAHRKIIKPLSGGDHAYIIGELNDDSERLASMTPQFVQEKLDGENLRVFSIAGNLFAFHLKTTEIDYRTDDKVSVHQVDVPDGIADQVGQLVEQIGFDYCALDFRCRSEFDSPVFLEVNSFPMFVAFDDACGNQLADAILDFLCG